MVETKILSHGGTNLNIVSGFKMWQSCCESKVQDF